MGSFNLMFLGIEGFAILHNNGLFHQLDYQDKKYIYLFIAYFLKHNLWQHTHGWIGVSKSCSKYLTWQCIEFCIGSKKVLSCVMLEGIWWWINYSFCDGWGNSWPIIVALSECVWEYFFGLSILVKFEFNWLEGNCQLSRPMVLTFTFVKGSMLSKQELAILATFYFSK